MRKLEGGESLSEPDLLDNAHDMCFEAPLPAAMLAAAGPL